MDREQVLKLFEYHHWAGDRAFDAIAGLSAEQLDRDWGGSFKTPRALLSHIIGAELVWLRRWQGASPKTIDPFPSTYAGRDFVTEWRKIRAAQRDFLDEMPRDRLSTDLTYVNLKGETWSFNFGDILQHVVNHGTYHRGQITHLLRDLALDAPSTDYVLFLGLRRK
jgi:uncharacterized damage-inducible protein DinB